MKYKEELNFQYDQSYVFGLLAIIISSIFAIIQLENKKYLLLILILLFTSLIAFLFFLVSFICTYKKLKRRLKWYLITTKVIHLY